MISIRYIVYFCFLLKLILARRTSISNFLRGSILKAVLALILCNQKFILPPVLIEKFLAAYCVISIMLCKLAVLVGAHFRDFGSEKCYFSLIVNNYLADSTGFDIKGLLAQSAVRLLGNEHRT